MTRRAGRQESEGGERGHTASRSQRTARHAAATHLNGRTRTATEMLEASPGAGAALTDADAAICTGRGGAEERLGGMAAQCPRAHTAPRADSQSLSSPLLAARQRLCLSSSVRTLTVDAQRSGPIRASMRILRGSDAALVGDG